MAFHQPTSLDAALSLVAQAGTRVIAGGTDVYPALAAQGQPTAFLDVTRVAGLRGISMTSDHLVIGAATTWSDLLRADLPPAFDGLKAAAREVGSVQIQNAGTVAGNLCNASPAADGVPPLLTLDAEVDLISAARGRRQLPLGAFLTGARQTALAGDELLVAIWVPTPPSGARSAFEKLGSRRYLVISIAMTAVLVVLDDAGRIADARVAVGACSATAQRLPALEAALVGQGPEQIVIDPDLMPELAPIDDTRGTAAYRRIAAAEQCRRALRKAAAGE